MYRHRQERLTFRLGVWPWGGQSYRQAMREIRFPMTEILDFLYRQLSNNHVYIRGAEFTLVNVSSKFTRMSYGSEPQPPTKFQDGPVTFTFSLRRNTMGYRERTSHRMTGATTIWGSHTPNDYITVTIPLNMAMRANMHNTLMLHLERLYKVVGMFTKSVALNLRRSNDNTVHEALLYRDIPRLLRRYPRHLWPYCLEAWSYPEMLNERHMMTPEFVAYYCTKLAGRVDSESKKAFHRYAVKTLSTAIVKLRAGTIDKIFHSMNVDLARIVTDSDLLPVTLAKQLMEGDGLD